MDLSKSRSTCPLSTALDLLGDKWSFVIIRDLAKLKARYKDFADSPEGIPTNILAKRLKTLEAAGVVHKQAYQDNPLRYEYFLTTAGAELLPVIQQLAKWGYKNIPGRTAPSDSFMKQTPKNLFRAQKNA